jgi:hypothetical protein
MILGRLLRGQWAFALFSVLQVGTRLGQDGCTTQAPLDVLVLVIPYPILLRIHPPASFGAADVRDHERLRCCEMIIRPPYRHRVYQHRLHGLVPGNLLVERSVDRHMRY